MDIKLISFVNNFVSMFMKYELKHSQILVFYFLRYFLYYVVYFNVIEIISEGKCLIFLPLIIKFILDHDSLMLPFLKRFN